MAIDRAPNRERMIRRDTTGTGSRIEIEGRIGGQLEPYGSRARAQVPAAIRLAFDEDAAAACTRDERPADAD